MAHMDVLLCEDVDNLGQRGQVVRVRAGYGRNYLLPQKLAIEASAGNKRMLDEQRRLLVKREQRERVSAQTEAEKLQGLELRFDRRVGEHGILFGSVTALDIAEALAEKGLKVERRRIALREHIKEVGEYDITISFTATSRRSSRCSCARKARKKPKTQKRLQQPIPRQQNTWRSRPRRMQPKLRRQKRTPPSNSM